MASMAQLNGPLAWAVSLPSRHLPLLLGLSSARDARAILRAGLLDQAIDPDQHDYSRNETAAPSGAGQSQATWIMDMRMRRGNWATGAYYTALHMYSSQLCNA
ncbi:hypothetical protein M431DRAFT_508798 [Trichoderma harzianum CBS 226.95]|uniref:Uncharacterized protein n=1 Tax=Trichoderma harzianum CBS 226.95 TaxID=983964 RepID=A0A2T4A9E1_TRIHA|nr:hypothetical protein M431DRAFT_508798 [Trichoderma harzianum CBS 226.95]PTB53714.1 hypothetical protein M431DRAFT_508798 [Trichoderma harzianum CBS 226.95]